MSWRSDPATENQLNVLDKNGIEYVHYITKGQASKIISKILSGQKIDKSITYGYDDDGDDDWDLDD